MVLCRNNTGSDGDGVMAAAAASSLSRVLSDGGDGDTGTGATCAPFEVEGGGSADEVEGAVGEEPVAVAGTSVMVPSERYLYGTRGRGFGGWTGRGL